ncbi:MAG TPA: transmembrane sensor/regulator PpyR [Cellvibrionaceae bacterium]
MTPQKLLNWAHGAMLGCLFLSAMMVYLAYGVPHLMSLPATVAAHIALIIFPAGLKIGYVLRLTALKQMGRAVN